MKEESRTESEGGGGKQESRKVGTGKGEKRARTIVPMIATASARKCCSRGQHRHIQSENKVKRRARRDGEGKHARKNSLGKTSLASL
jgi:hypothetical protein